MNRIIARTNSFAPIDNPEPRPPLGDLALRPVVYAASSRADNDSPPGSLPSETLAEALIERAGASRVTRVDDWGQWSTAVSESGPQLLVVLGHTEAGQAEFSIEIGTNSFLHQPDISAAYVSALTGPAPVVLLFSCGSGASGDVFGTLAGTFIGRGAAAVVASWTKFNGKQAAEACATVASALYTTNPVDDDFTLGTALMNARRDLVGRGLLAGLLLVAVGEIDIKFGL